MIEFKLFCRMFWDFLLEIKDWGKLIGENKSYIIRYFGI